LVKRLLAVDICNTLADINEQIAKALGPNPNPSNYIHPGTSIEFFENNSWVFQKALPFDGAAEGVQYLSKSWEIIYLTARPEWARQITNHWLTKWGFPSGSLITTNEKAIQAQLLGISMAVEDAPHEILSLQKAGIPVMVHTQPYNNGLGNYRFSWNSFQKKDELVIGL